MSRIAARFYTTGVANKDLVLGNLVNRNPRNLEKLGVGYKPAGYHLENPGRCYWHTLNLHVTGKYVTASIVHFENGSVLEASTKEWPIKKQLYRTNDYSAYQNLGRVLAMRCLQSGIIEVQSFLTSPVEDGKVSALLKALQEGGVALTEPGPYKKPFPWSMHRPSKYWEVTE